MNVKVYTLNAFAKTPNGGNPAGVVLGADAFTDTQMLEIADKVGFSETAFIHKSEVSDFKLRYFTPVKEVDLCGHATIATFSLLYSLGKIKAGSCSIETKAGILAIEIKEDGTVFMQQQTPTFSTTIEQKEIADSLNIGLDKINNKLPIQIVSTGLRDIIVPIQKLDDLLVIQPDFDAVQKISKKYDTIGYHLFTLETKNSSIAQCRNFAPLYAIPEESATGTSNGALGCYLFEYGILNEIKAKKMVFEQGHSMNRPSEIFVQLETKGKEVNRVLVGGRSVLTGKKLINLQ